MSGLSNPSRRAVLGFVAQGAASVAGCVVAPYRVRGGRGPVQQDPGYDGPVVMVEPPPPYEAPVPAPAVGYVWIGGYWNWVGSRHVWVRHGPGSRMAPGGWRRG